MPRRRHEVSLLDVLSDYRPQRMSNGQLRMECPFRENHADGSGRMSFFVSPNINAYHCFSCGAKGNLVKLLTRRFKVNYFEAMDMVQFRDYTPEKKEFDLDLMWDWHKSPEEFLGRGYTKDTLRHFRVGMTEDDEILIPYYRTFTRPTELLGYQKRWYSPDRRVLNSKAFDKRTYLYNLDTSFAYVVLVEGQSDVWRLYQHGYNACALMGDDISFQQVEQLSKFDRVYLALDNDTAGRRCTEICYYFLKNQTTVKLVPYQTKDPGECSRKKEWVDAFEASTDYITYSLEMALGWDGYLAMRDEVVDMVSRRKE